MQSSNITVPGDTDQNYFTLAVYAPNGSEVAGGYCNGSSPGASCRYSLWNLAAGTYSVVATPTFGGTINFTAQLQSDVSEGALSASTPAAINLAQGQVQRFTFNANTGDTVALNLSGVTSTAPTGQAVYVNVYRPDTGAINTNNYYTQFDATGSQTLSLPNLPVGGTYTAVVYTPYGTPANGQLTLVPQ